MWETQNAKQVRRAVLECVELGATEPQDEGGHRHTAGLIVQYDQYSFA